MQKYPDSEGEKTKPIQACPERSRMEPISRCGSDVEWIPAFAGMTNGGGLVRRSNPNHLKKQSQFSAAEKDVNSFVKDAYGNKHPLNSEENKANQSQFVSCAAVVGIELRGEGGYNSSAPVGRDAELAFMLGELSKVN